MHNWVFGVTIIFGLLSIVDDVISDTIAIVVGPDNGEKEPPNWSWREYGMNFSYGMVIQLW